MSKINHKIKTLRSEFSNGFFDEKSVPKNPLALFEDWMQFAIDSNVAEPNAMTLATLSPDGFTEARIVLLRSFDKNGFSFFTNYNSIKGKGIRHHKKIGVNFFWADLHRQIRIKGVASKLSAERSNEYFYSRPLESQIGAWASHQSESLINRKELDDRYKMYELKFAGKKIPRPPHWGGFIIKPVYFEFWQGRPNRLHDRIVYLKQKQSWKLGRLNP